jgi:hypothetical protein
MLSIEDLAVLMGKTKEEVEELLKTEEVIELNLKERNQKEVKDSGKIELLNQ